MTVSAVRDAWASVFSHSNLSAITNKAYNYDILTDEQQDEGELVDAQTLNFFTYTITFKKKIIGTSSQTTTEYYVAVKYYRESDSSGAAHRAIVDALETLYSTVVTVLGSKWSDTIDFWIPQTEEVGAVSVIEIDNKPVLTSSFVFRGSKTI